MKKLMGALLLATAVATPAMAGDSPIYVGAEVGKDHLGVLGGLKIDDMFAVEMSYNMFDEEKVVVPFMVTTVDAWAVGMHGVINFPVAPVPGLSVFGKAGFEYVEVETTTRIDLGGGNVMTTTATDDDIDFAGGAGAQYEITPSFSVRAGVHIKGQADSVYANAIYRF